MVANSYFNASHFTESFQSLYDLRENGEVTELHIFIPDIDGNDELCKFLIFLKQTCDIRLLASNKEIKAHKIVLASVSEYFKNAIYGLFLNDSSKNELELKEVQFEILSAILHYMYTGKIDIHCENVFDIYAAADYYLINFLKDTCLNFMQENLDIDNCVKIWVIANNCKNEKLRIAVGNFMLTNLEIASNKKEFLNLSNEEILDFFKYLPKPELFDSIITAVLRWAAGKDEWKESVINILKDIPIRNISEDYLENYLSTNEFIQNSIVCNNWMMNIYKEKSKLHKLKQAEAELKLENKKVKLKQAESEAELKFTRFLSDQPIIFFDSLNNNSYKYNRFDGEFNIYNKSCNANDAVYDYKPYQNFIYVVKDHICKRFRFDALNKNECEKAFHHNHGPRLRVTILNDSMYMFGGNQTYKKGTNIDLNTKQATNFSLLHDRTRTGVAVSDGAIYLCAGDRTNMVERFDPREGRTTHFGSMLFKGDSVYGYSSAALSNEIYCTNGRQHRILDIRNNRALFGIQPPARGEIVKCFVSSYGKIYGVSGLTIYEYNNAYKIWQNLGRFSELANACRAISFE